MEQICYFCGQKALDWRADFKQLETLYTKTSISDILKRFLNDFESQRDLDTPTNSICMRCLDQIDEYDFACVEVAKKEKVLRDLLLSTENRYDGLQVKVEAEDLVTEFEETYEEVNIDCDLAVNSCEILMEEQAAQSSGEGDDDDTQNQKESKAEDINQTQQQPPIRQPRRPCKICNDGKLYNVSKYKFHMIRHQRICKICDISFKWRAKFEKHMAWHETTEGLECSVCGFQLDDKNAYENHMELHKSGGAEFQCVLCNVVRPSKHLLKYHMQSHSDGQMCDVCGKKFFTRNALRVHRNIHTKERKWECSICSKVFLEIGNFHQHMKSVHTQDRPFGCSVCGMKFKRRDACRVHERRHTEDTKVEKCLHCPAAFEHKFHLKQHMEKKHGVGALKSDANEIN